MDNFFGSRRDRCWWPERAISTGLAEARHNRAPVVSDAAAFQRLSGDLAVLGNSAAAEARAADARHEVSPGVLWFTRIAGPAQGA